MSHFVKICEYGKRHGTCRCAGPKVVEKVVCDDLRHKEESTLTPEEINPTATPTLNLEESHFLVSHLMNDGTREGLILAGLINERFGASARRRHPENFPADATV